MDTEMNLQTVLAESRRLRAESARARKGLQQVVAALIATRDATAVARQQAAHYAEIRAANRQEAAAANAVVPLPESARVDL